MQLRDIAWASLKRRRGRFVFALAAVVLGIGTVVALASLSRAMRAEIGDELGVKVDASFGRIDAQTAKQVIFQKVRDAEREVIFNEFIGRKGEIITGIARRVERGNLIIDSGKTDAVLPRGISGSSLHEHRAVQTLTSCLTRSASPKMRR